MNDQELKLAENLSEWGETKARMDELEADIRECVLSMGRSQGLGAVKATYNSGRKSYDYQEGALRFSADMDTFNAVVNDNSAVHVDWKTVCMQLGADQSEIPFTQGEPSVSIKLLKENER